MEKFQEALMRYRHTFSQLHLLMTHVKSDGSDMTEEKKEHVLESYRILIKEMRTNFMDMEQANYDFCTLYEKEMKKYFPASGVKEE